MKTTIDKDFFEKWSEKGVVMWCKKEEYAKEFCRLMHEQGLRWSSEKSYLENNFWGHYKTETSYSFNNKVYADKYYYESEDYTILDFEDYIVKEEKMTKEELVKLMIDNFSNENGYLDLSGLDFSEYDCDINIGHMKAPKNLFQDCQAVKSSLFQDDQNVVGDLNQSGNIVRGNLYQDLQEVQGDLCQDKEDVEYINKTNNLPAHYNIAGIDTMDLILTICEHNNTNQRETFYLANTLKYLIRYNNKNGIDDLEKAKDYLNRLINNQKGE